MKVKKKGSQCDRVGRNRGFSAGEGRRRRRQWGGGNQLLHSPVIVIQQECACPYLVRAPLTTASTSVRHCPPPQPAEQCPPCIQRPLTGREEGRSAIPVSLHSWCRPLPGTDVFLHRLDSPSSVISACFLSFTG